MKQISLKFLIILWFGVLLAGLSAISTVLMLNIRSDAVTVDMKAVLAFEVYGCSDRVAAHLDDPAAVTLSERADVTVALYSADGSRISGELPEYLEVPEFEDRIFRTSGDYYIYDYYIDLEDGYWLRGYCGNKAVPLTTQSPSGIAAFMLPGVAILGTAAGFVIFLLSLRQIKKLQREIDEISGGEDLSRRIRMRVSSSEIARLSASFNGMIGRLEQSFRAETQFASNASHELRTPTTTILA
ncbi:MAG: HAMP domain-containing protein, partial [Oscillospiraceae bacterium]|nr:HAMP domain-containing protein [Oscillospiraceae bacterium]